MFIITPRRFTERAAAVGLHDAGSLLSDIRKITDNVVRCSIVASHGLPYTKARSPPVRTAGLSIARRARWRCRRPGRYGGGIFIVRVKGKTPEIFRRDPRVRYWCKPVRASISGAGARASAQQRLRRAIEERQKRRQTESSLHMLDVRRKSR